MNKKEISMTTKKRLAKIFAFIGEQEQQLEFARQNLCKANAFEPYASFQRLDRFSKGYLTSKDLLNFLKDNGINNVDDLESKHVISFFDSTGEERLMYTDYLQMLLPCDQPYLRASATQRPTYPIAQDEYLPFEVERLLAKLIQKEMKLSRESEKLKQELAARYDYNLDHLFKEVDDWNYKYIDSANLKRFLIKTGIFPNDTLLIAIIRRFDLDADAKLKQTEFMEGIKPQQEYSKRQLKEKETITTSRIFSASKNKSTMRSASKGRSAIKSKAKREELSQSRNQILSSQKKKQLKSSKKAQTTSIQNDEQELMTRSRLDTESARERNLRSLIGSPQTEKSRQSYFRDEQHSPLRSQLQTLNESHKGQSPLQQSHLSRSYGNQFNQSKSPKRDDRKSMEPSLIYLMRECLKEILAIEGGLEQIKKELAVRQDFTLAGAFNMFTGYSQSRISASDLLYGLERLGVVCDIADAQLVIQRYDSDQDGKLGFWEFSNVLMPIDAIMRDDLERRKAIWDIGFETKELLRRTFRKIVDAECMIESIRQRINREQSVSLRSAFDSLDWLGRGFLTSSEFKRAFEQTSLTSSQSSYQVNNLLRQDSVELEGMIRRFNKDKLNGRIMLPEFLDELTPRCQEKPY